MSLKKRIKNIVSTTPWMMRLYQRLITFRSKPEIDNKGVGRLRVFVDGRGNSISVGRDTVFKGASVRIVGDNNRLVIEDGCRIGAACSFWLEGENLMIRIGRGTTMNHNCHFNAQERDNSIVIGEDGQLSNNIIVRTSDSHPIYDNATDRRINPAESVTVGRHVWIAPDTKIMKGVTIADGCIIGSNSLVTRDIPADCLAVGAPARVVRENVRWTREHIFDYRSKK